MSEPRENIVLEKSYRFALRIVRLYKYLCDDQKEFVMSRELLKAGTNVGARVRAAQEAESKPAFAHEINTALQFAVVTTFWLELLRDSDYLDEKKFASINDDCVELQKLLRAIGKSADPRRR